MASIKTPSAALTDLPWLTGPLIAPPEVVVPVGHYSIQPFLSFNVNTARYNADWNPSSIPNFYTLSLQVQTLIGLTKWMDFQINPLVLFNATQGQSSTRFADLPLGFDFQLINVDKYRWFPGIKLQLIETFPTGQYQKLNPKKLNTGISGFGSFYTSADLIFYKVYHLSGLHYLSATLSLGYTVFAPVHIKGFSVYKGSFNTRGKVYPGNSYTGILSFEYTFDEHWVFALDNVYTHSNKTHFSGKRGWSSPGVLAIVGSPSSEQLSFAPALEYNFSANLGLIAGAWFSAAGRNSFEFYSGIFSFIYSY
jgi:hypothetical protein